MIVTRGAKNQLQQQAGRCLGPRCLSLDSVSVRFLPAVDIERLSVCRFDLRLQNAGRPQRCDSHARQFSAPARAIMLFQDTSFKWPSIRRKAADLAFFYMSVCRHRRCNVCVMILNAAAAPVGQKTQNNAGEIPNPKFYIAHVLACEASSSDADSRNHCGSG